MINFIKRIKSFFNVRYHNQRLKEQLNYDIRNLYLIDKVLNCKESGITNKKNNKNEIIVSLTTYGKRLFDVAITIESIMQGSMKPNRIVLWLGEDMRNITLPITLQKQQNRGLEISYCKDIRSYKKLIPTLKKYPEASIITIDDDAIYEYDLVEKLVNMHKLYPQSIIANRIHQMVLDQIGKPVSYMKWNWYANPKESSPLNFFTSGGGVLFPPHSLNIEVFNEHVFTDICKYADDVWWNAMALKEGTNVLKCYTHDKRGEDYLMNMNVQDIGLFKINTVGECGNDKQIKAVYERYDLWEKLKVRPYIDNNSDANNT